MMEYRFALCRHKPGLYIISPSSPKEMGLFAGPINYNILLVCNRWLLHSAAMRPPLNGKNEKDVTLNKLNVKPRVPWPRMRLCDEPAFENRQPVTVAKFLYKSSLFILLLGVGRLQLSRIAN
jgi:hypothetical protein